MRFKTLAAAVLLACAGMAIAAEDSPVSITVSYHNRAQLQKIASRFQHVIVDVERKTVRVEAVEADIDTLRREGFKVEIDQAETERLQRIDSAMRSDAGTQSIPNYSCYRTVEETYTTIDDLVTLYPTLAQKANIGASWEKTRNSSNGYDMKVLKLTNAATDSAIPNKPVMVVFGSIHAREYAPAELVTRFAEWLAEGHGTNDEATWLLDNFQFHLILQANPDGRKKAEAGNSWRKNTNTTNGSCSFASQYGTDLNRNFPFHWNTTNGQGSSGDACAETYRGPSAGSDPETRNLVAYVAGTRNASGVYTGGVLPDRRNDAANSAAPEDYQGLFFDIHSYGKLVMWPWGDISAQAPNVGALRALGRRMAYFNGYKPQKLDALYLTDGTTVDTMYGLLGVPGYTFELGQSFFESCSNFTGTILPDNLKALRYAARNLYAPYKYPSGPDTTAISVSSSSVAAGTPVTVTATVDDSKFNQSNGTETTQNIASAKAYLDAPPWASGATAISLSASDGSFNATSENVTGSVATTGLSAGVHTIYVQGTDTDGKPGTPQAVRFTVTGDGGGNVAPVANFTSSTSGLTATFTDTSTDSDGTIASRSWDFGDGTTSTATNPSKTYSADGTYTVKLTVKDDDGASNTKTGSVTVGGGGDNVLSNGVAKTDQSGAKAASLRYTLAVPSGASGLKFVTSGGTGDADLYVKFNAAPTTTSNDCKSEGSTNAETCTIATAQAGTYHVLVYGYAAFSGLSITGSYTTGGGGSQTYSNTTDYTISDNATVDSPITVSGRTGNGPAAASVAVAIVHTYIGDLKVDLVAPDGSLYNIHNRSGGSADNINKTVSLNVSTEALNGTWKLRVNDNAANDVGYINSWSITF